MYQLLQEYIEKNLDRKLAYDSRKDAELFLDNVHKEFPYLTFEEDELLQEAMERFISVGEKIVTGKEEEIPAVNMTCYEDAWKRHLEEILKRT